jgi:hypothetical protein
MAQLTYDPTPADQPEFSAEEQDSLEVGERLNQEESALLAGKYTNAEELEKAYLELQTKLGSETKQPEEQEEQVEQEEESEYSNLFDELWNKAQTDEVSDELINQLNEQTPEDLTQMYMEYRQQVEESKPPTMTSEDVEGLKGLVGGDEGYNNLISWAAENLSEQDISMYDAVMDKGDPLACFFAVQALSYRYQDTQPVDGQMLTGKPAVDRVNAFRSQAELVAAQADPRYDNDPAYRQDVYAKLERSNLQF